MSDEAMAPPHAHAAHVLALPFPEHGHINPMLRFCGHLASRGVTVTFVNTEKAQHQVSGLHPWASQLSSLRFATIPGDFHANVEGGQPKNALTITQALMSGIERQRDVLRQLVVDSRSSDLPVSCFLVDPIFMSWAISFCNELRIRKAFFFPFCGWFLSFIAGNYPLRDVTLNDNIDANQTVIVGGIHFNAQELDKAIPVLMRQSDMQKMFKDGYESLDNESLVIVNTFERLEEPSLKATITQAHVCYVGPILPINVNHNFTRFSKFNEENECLNWRDKHEEHSVLYISLGSTTCLNSEQLEELAFGLQQSKRPFLWVIRDNIDLLPHEFLEQTHDRGFLVKWAPQLEVLSHPSIGGFLTHCGWNSIMESIYMGVPLLCFPFFADQHINSLLVTKIWNVGILIDQEKSNGIMKDSIEKSIEQLMSSIELRQQVSTLKMYAHEAIEPMGSSYKTMEKIIDVMKEIL